MHGKHLIAGNWVASDQTFISSPATGEGQAYSVGTPALVDQAVEAAEKAFWTYGYSEVEERAKLLERIADEIEARAAAITEIGTQETGLPAARLDGERGRTTGQLRLFAAHIRDGEYQDVRHDEALPDRMPAPRPELYMMQRPIGPVAVFGASNFPLAFSVAGGDTAAALAAGCPVVVKGHSAHPGTGEVVAEAIHAALKALDIDPGVFSLVQGGKRDVGQALVEHPLIKAVGFTGSLAGGRALFDACARRPEPIPFFGELGSINPVFMLPNALANRADEIGSGWAGSLTMGAGQFCTNPGVAVVIDGDDADRFANAARTALATVGAQTMLTDGIAEAYREGTERVKKASAIEPLLESNSADRFALPNLYAIDAESWLSNEDLSEEVFGPLGIIVKVKDFAQMLKVAQNFVGQLTCTLCMDEADENAAASLLPILERKAGRVMANNFPTGVEVCDTMVHGGPYPASTNFGATSVGTLSIRRFLRPVCYQNIPSSLRHSALR